MIYLVTGDKKAYREKIISSVTKPLGESEVIFFDDTYGSLFDLEQYLYPSLFSISAPVLHCKYILSTDSDKLTPDLVKKLLASPTCFIFEEVSVPTSTINFLKKSGAVIHIDAVSKTTKKDADIFGVTNALTGKDKKTRWIAYNKALKNHPVEAIIGILYWKVRDLAAKNPKQKEEYVSMYKRILDGHVLAWQTGAPLSLIIEKIILT